MITRAIRGAITVKDNSEYSIRLATLELLTAVLEKNNIKKEDISHVIFTLTKDLNAAFPAKFARVDLNWDNIAMMCYNEIDVPNSLEKCLRVMVVINCDKDFRPQFVYLKGAADLRR